jgi:hypothetical protein
MPDRPAIRSISEVRVPRIRGVKDVGWIVAFVALCAAWSYEVVHATRYSAVARNDTGVWICPILGRCGPPGTPGIGRW